MLVNFIDKKEPVIFHQQDYSDISPILSLVESRAMVSIFLDPEGDERVIGRFFQCEYTIEVNDCNAKESLSVIIDCEENTVNYLKLSDISAVYFEKFRIIKV